MQALLNIVEEQSPPQQNISIDLNTLKFSTSKLKLWDYARLNFDDYKKLFIEDYVDMVSKYGDSSGISFLVFSAPAFFLGCCNFSFLRILFFVL